MPVKSFIFPKQSSKIYLWLLASMLAVALTMLQDAFRAYLNQSGFYIQESLLFSSFWWLAGPMMAGQLYTFKKGNNQPKWIVFLVSLWPIPIHIIGYPLLVWLLSALFYEHTFDWLQTLRHTISEYLLIILAMYLSSSVFFYYLEAKRRMKSGSSLHSNKASNFTQNLTVKDGNKQLLVPVNDIFYFNANTPYIDIHLEGRKHLINESLKNLLVRLSPDTFVRIHKSAIVNVSKVDHLISRQNGDYDVILTNGKTIRLSRNYVASFRTIYQAIHQVSI